jgi:hypothetical protein
VDLNPDAVMVSVHQETGEGSYRFVCPKCTEPVEKRADRRIVALLKSVGVGVAETAGETEVPVGEPHPESSPGGPLFTTDDVINFHSLRTTRPRGLPVSGPSKLDLARRPISGVYSRQDCYTPRVTVGFAVALPW